MDCMSCPKDRRSAFHMLDLCCSVTVTSCDMSPKVGPRCIFAECGWSQCCCTTNNARWLSVQGTQALGGFLLFAIRCATSQAPQEDVPNCCLCCRQSLSICRNANFWDASVHAMCSYLLDVQGIRNGTLQLSWEGGLCIGVLAGRIAHFRFLMCNHGCYVMEQRLCTLKHVHAGAPLEQSASVLRTMVLEVVFLNKMCMKVGSGQWRHAWSGCFILHTYFQIT